MYLRPLLARQPLTHALLALLLLLALPACSTTERAADTTADAAEDAAEATADVAEDVGEAVVDAAGASYNAVADLFDDDGEVDAAALVRPTIAGSAQGTVTLEEVDGGVEVTVSLRDLDPGEHGVHVHANGSCGPADTDGDGQMEPAGAAGGHFDPMNTNNHGAPTEDMMGEKHIGDLGNVTANGSGMAETSMTIDGLALTGANGLVGHAIVVHAGRDDLESDPSGNSGDPVGCGVITARN